MMQHHLPAPVAELFARDERIVYVVRYDSGFVPNRYRWPAPGVRTVFWRDGTRVVETYDRKRSYGRGPWLVAFSGRGGRLASVR